MPVTRVQGYTNTLGDILAPRVGVPITLTLFTPNNLPVSNLDAVTIMPGLATQKKTATDSTGAYTISGDALADLPAGCYYQLLEGDFPTVITDTTYSSSPINVTTLYPTPVVDADTMKMKATLGYIDSNPMQGQSVSISLSDKAVTSGAVTKPGGVPRVYPTDVSGTVAVIQDITTTMTPSDTVYNIRWPGGAIDSYVVPPTPHGWQGTYNAGTTYSRHSGTAASPADVVVDAGIWYRYINATPAAGQTPASSPTYWAVFDGEPIEWNIVPSGTAGARSFSAAQITADATVPSAMVASPTDVQDVLSNLLYEQHINTYTPALQGATDNPTATYTTQIGRYMLVGKRCYVTIVVVTSTMTKTTDTDNIRVSLPVAAANVANDVQLLMARAENGTAVKVASLAETIPNSSYLHLRQINATAASALLTYQSTSIGVLTNTITINVSGWYETA